MIVTNVVASITPKVTAQNISTQEQPAGDFGSVLSAAADKEAKVSEKTVQPDAVVQSEASRAAETSDDSCSCCPEDKGVEVPVSESGMSSEVSASHSGGYAIYFSWYVRVADDVGKVESPAVQLFHDVAEKISDVFLKNDGWSGNPIQALLTGTESVVQKDSAQVGSYLGSLLKATTTGLQSLVQTLNNGILWPGSSSSSSSSSAMSSNSSLISTAFDTSYLTDIALAKLQYGNSSSSSIGNSLNIEPSTAKPLPRNTLGGQIVMVSSEGATVSSNASSTELKKVSSDASSKNAARLFLEAFKTFIESLKRNEAEKNESKTGTERETAQAAGTEESQEISDSAIKA